MTAAELRRALDLQPHPEGGAFREVYRSPLTVAHPAVSDDSARAALTSIYFLLEITEFPAFHRVASYEGRHLYAGGPLELHLIHPDGREELQKPGTNFAAGERPQAVVPAGVWQAARPAPGVAWALCGSVVAPGFTCGDFEMPTRAELLSQFPHADPRIPGLIR